MPSVEWYTPSIVIEAARATMGSIDLDPASCEEANERVKASKFFTIDDDGLQFKWSGNVWLNPPFGAIDTRKFIGKLVDEYRNGEVNQACLLIPYVPGSKHVSTLFGQFIHCHEGPGRVKFFRPGSLQASTIQHPIVTFYLGSREEAFCDNFKLLGSVCKPIGQYSTQHSLFNNAQWTSVFNDP